MGDDRTDSGSARLSGNAQARKDTPMARGLLDYFPDALAEVAHVSKIGNDQHNPGQPLHWAKEKSTDHADCIIRHLVDRGTMDTDGVRHSAKVAWRALALLQIELEKEATPNGAVHVSDLGSITDEDFKESYRAFFTPKDAGPDHPPITPALSHKERGLGGDLETRIERMIEEDRGHTAKLVAKIQSDRAGAASADARDHRLQEEA